MILLLFLFQFRNPTALAAENVHIGIASNFSEVSLNSSNPYGDFFKNGINLALKDHSTELTKRGINIVLDEYDYGNTPIKALEIAKKTIDSSAIGVIGYNFSSHALLAAPLYQAAKMPMLTPSATADRIGKMGSFIHTGCFNNTFMGKTLAHIAWNKLKAKKAAIVVAADCAYCVDLAMGFEKEFTSLGGEITIKKDILESDRDFSSVVASFKQHPSKNYDVILIPNQEINSAFVISAILKAGINKPFLGGDGWGDVGEKFFSVIGSSTLKGYSLSHWHYELKTPETKRFLKAFEKEFHKKPNDSAVLAYDSMSILINSIIAAKTLTRAGLEESINKIKKFDGVTGHFDFIDGSAPQKSSTLLTTKAIKFVPIELIAPIKISAHPSKESHD